MCAFTPLGRPLLAAQWTETRISDGPSELAAAGLANEVVSHIIGGDAGPESMSIRAVQSAHRAVSDRWNETLSFSELADQAHFTRAFREIEWPSNAT